MTPRLYIQSDLEKDKNIYLQDSQMHYLIKVLRRTLGDSCLLFNGRDGEWRADISEIAKKEVALEVVEQTQYQRDVPDLWLAFAPIKLGKIDYLVEKATELGCSKLIPIITDRTVVNRVNTSRLLANAIEAAEQSGRMCIPTIEEPVKLMNLLKEWPDDRTLIFCDESGSGLPTHRAFNLYLQRKLAYVKDAIFVGPEGGFTEREQKAIANFYHVLPISLGPRILRAETAALAALATYQMVLGDWPTGRPNHKPEEEIENEHRY